MVNLGEAYTDFAVGLKFSILKFNMTIYGKNLGKRLRTEEGKYFPLFTFKSPKAEVMPLQESNQMPLQKMPIDLKCIKITSTSYRKCEPSLGRSRLPCDMHITAACKSLGRGAEYTAWYVGRGLCPLAH